MQIKEYLNKICEQIKYKPVREEISKEIEDHINDIKEDLIKNKDLELFDFYIDDKYLIEYDGKQHFKNEGFFDYESTHRHDLIKNQWCKDNNIPLIRIPYTHYDNLCLEDLLLETSNFIVK